MIVEDLCSLRVWEASGLGLTAGRANTPVLAHRVSRAGGWLDSYSIKKTRIKLRAYCKQANDFPVPSRDVTYQTLPGREQFNHSRPKEFDKWHPGWGRENCWLFFTLQSFVWNFFSLCSERHCPDLMWYKQKLVDHSKVAVSRDFYFIFIEVVSILSERDHTH